MECSYWGEPELRSLFSIFFSVHFSFFTDSLASFKSLRCLTSSTATLTRWKSAPMKSFRAFGGDSKTSHTRDRSSLSQIPRSDTHFSSYSADVCRNDLVNGGDLPEGTSQEHNLPVFHNHGRRNNRSLLRPTVTESKFRRNWTSAFYGWRIAFKSCKPWKTTK